MNAPATHGRLTRHSYRVRFTGGTGAELAGIVDRPVVAKATSDTSGADAPANAAQPLPPNTPVAVFSHCFTCSKDLKAITRISRRLSEDGIAVLRFDMTGLGGSQGDFSETNFSTNLSDLTAAIEFAAEELGAVTALIGHSFGGAASLAIAAGMPAPRASELLGETHRQSIGSVVSIAAPSDTQHLAELLNLLNANIQTDGRGDVVIGGNTWTITREMLDDFRSHRLADHLPNIRCPVLAFHSPVDRTLGYDHALRIASLVHDHDGLPACSLVTLSGADHLLVDQPRDAEFVAATISAFLHRHR